MNIKKHLKCFALFIGVLAGYAVFMAVALVIAVFLAWLITPTGIFILIAAVLLGCFVYITHGICKNWD